MINPFTTLYMYKYKYTLHPLLTRPLCTRYREMLVLGNTTSDKEGSLALGTCTGSERSGRAHIFGQQGNIFKLFQGFGD